MAARGQQWRDQRLVLIRALKSPTQDQRTLLALVDREGPDAAEPLTPAEKRQLDALWKLERAAEQAQSARTALAELAADDRKKKRKERDHRVYQRGALLGTAGLIDFDTGHFRVDGFDDATLLGALLGLARVSDPERLASWQKAGRAKFDELERAEAHSTDATSETGSTSTRDPNLADLGDSA